jgi:hypothetical protein
MTLSRSTVEDRLRVALHTVADLPTGQLEPTSRRTSQRPLRRRVSYGVAIVAAAALVAVGVLAVQGLTRSGSQEVQVGSGSQRPANITGPEQHLRVADTAQAKSSLDTIRASEPSTRHAFEVRGAIFAVGRFRVRSDGQLAVGIAIGTVTTGSAGGQNAYIIPADFIVADFPKSGQQLAVWSGLPKAAAFVTLSYQRHLVAWQRPLYGTAGFLLGEVNRARTLTFTAYDAQGTLLTKVVQHVAPTA